MKIYRAVVIICFTAALFFCLIFERGAYNEAHFPAAYIVSYRALCALTVLPHCSTVLRTVGIKSCSDFISILLLQYEF